MAARCVNIVLGLWLFVSAFSWPHSIGTQTNSWVVGALIAMTGLGAMYEPATRWANTFLSLWLFVTSFWFFHPSPATAWNNAVVALLVFLASLVPNPPLPRGTTSTR